MMNIYTTVSTGYVYYTLETILYGYPRSRATLTYRAKKDAPEKKFYIDLYYNQYGYRVYHCKHSIAKVIQDMLAEHHDLHHEESSVVTRKPILV